MGDIGTAWDLATNGGEVVFSHGGRLAVTLAGSVRVVTSTTGGTVRVPASEARAYVGRQLWALGIQASARAEARRERSARAGRIHNL